MDRAEERVALIECVGRDGRGARIVDVRRWPATIGRAIDNDVVVDDPHVASHHAVIEPTEATAGAGGDGSGGLSLRVLDTRNGVVVDGRRHRSGARVPLPPAGARLVVGTVALRLRLRGEPLDPERPLPGATASRRVAPLAAGAAFFALAAAQFWVAIDPGADASDWLPMAVGLPAVVAAWCAFWALMSKLFQHRFDFAGHLRIVLPFLLAIQLVDVVLPYVAASLGWPWLWRLSGPLQVLLTALLVRAHLVHVQPLHPRTVGAVVAVAVAVGAGVALSFTYRSTDRYSRPPYMSTLPLPAVNAAPTTPTATLVDALAPMAARLDERVQRARDEEADEEAVD